MKPEYRVETFKSAEDFQDFLNKLDDGWQLHSFAPGAVQWAVAVLWKYPAPIMFGDVASSDVAHPVRSPGIIRGKV